MLWITRPRPHIDRTASAWLIRRFVDQNAEFGFADSPEGAAQLGGTPFDMRGVELGHHGGHCTFEALLQRYQLNDPALAEIAAIVRDVDLDEEPHRTPEGHGVDAVIRGLGLVIGDDLELLAVTDRIYDGLYAWARSIAR
jgi:hypothetical protein